MRTRCALQRQCWASVGETSLNVWEAGDYRTEFGSGQALSRQPGPRRLHLPRRGSPATAPISDKSPRRPERARDGELRRETPCCPKMCCRTAQRPAIVPRPPNPPQRLPHVPSADARLGFPRPHNEPHRKCERWRICTQRDHSRRSPRRDAGARHRVSSLRSRHEGDGCSPRRLRSGRRWAIAPAST